MVICGNPILGQKVNTSDAFKKPPLVVEKYSEAYLLVFIVRLKVNEGGDLMDALHIMLKPR